MPSKNSKKREKRSSEPASFGAVLRQSALCAGLSLFLTLLLSLIAAALISMLSDPSVASAAIGTGGALFSYLLSGILSAKKSACSPVLAGVCSGSLLSILLLFAGFLFSSSPFRLAGWLLKLSGILLSVMGAFLASTRPKSRRRTKAHSHGRV